MNSKQVTRPPALPLPPDARALVDYCLDFREISGFVAVYQYHYVQIKYSNRKKRGMKAAAYEATEQLYVQLLNRGRRFPDVENFRWALSKFKRQK